MKLWCCLYYYGPAHDVLLRAYSVGKYNTPNKDAYIYLTCCRLFFSVLCNNIFFVLK